MTFPAVTVEFSPTTGPFATPTWISLSDNGPHGSRVLSADWVDGKQDALGEFPPGEATITLLNDDRLFDPEYAAGTYFGKLNPRVPFRITVLSGLTDSLSWGVDSLTWGVESLTWGVAATQDQFYGYVEDGWEQDYDPPAVSSCTVKLVDLLGVIAGYTLPSVVETEILADSAQALWPLAETSGTVMVDRSGYGRNGVYLARTTTLAGEIGAFDLPALILDGNGYGVVPGTVYTSGSLEAVIDLSGISDFVSGEVLTIIESGSGDARARRDHHFGVEIVSASAGTARLFLRSSSTVSGFWSGIGGFGYSLPFDFRKIHHVWAVAPSSFGNRAFYIDGVLSTGTTSPPDASGAFADLSVGKSKTAGNFRGGLSTVAVSTLNLSATRIMAHATAALAPLDQQRSDQQIAWALAAIGVPSTMYLLDVGAAVMGPAAPKGRNALEWFREIAATELGGFYVDHQDGGRLRFRNRYASFTAARSTATQVTFSDDPAASDGTVARVLPDTLQVQPNGIQTVINQVSVGWSGGTEVVDTSAGSVYGPRPLSVTTQSQSALVARGLGQWLIALNGTPKAKIRSLTIDPGSNHLEFDIALGARIGDRAAYRSHPQSTGVATTKALEVLGRHHTVQGLSWQTEFYLGAAPSDGVTLFTLGTSALNGTHVLAF